MIHQFISRCSWDKDNNCSYYTRYSDHGQVVRHFYTLKVHSTGSLIIPLSVDFIQADVQDNQRYPVITSSLTPNKVRYAADDLGYNDHKLYIQHR